MEIQDFVNRAEGAEKKLALLQTRLTELEAAVAVSAAQRSSSSAASSSTPASVATPSTALPANLLASLKQLRERVVVEDAEREALKKENEALKTSVRKLEYRCNHLVTMLEVEEKLVADLKKGK